MTNGQPHKLDGRSLNEDSLAAIANGADVEIASACLKAMDASHDLIEQAVAKGQPVYGVTTGLGPKVTQRLSPEELTEFSLSTIRGRAHAIGPPLSKPIVRAGLAIRLNTLLNGASGASASVATHVAACLNADLIPYIGETTSTGPADLMWGGTMALALIGEGRFLGMPEGQSAAEALAHAGIPPLNLRPRDGLSLVSHSSFSAAYAALGLHCAKTSWHWAQVAAGLSLEAFRANLTPFRADVLTLASQPGAQAAAKDLMDRLAGSALLEKGAARRLQDPLSFRNIAQVHGSLYAALETLEHATTCEMNAAPDSPAVFYETQEIVSTGNFLNPFLSITLVGANQAIVQVAAQITARISRLLSNRFTDLPNGLNAAAAGNAGLGPLTKVSEGLFGEIAHLAAPPIIYASSSADGVEDAVNYTAISGKALLEIDTRLRMLLAIEMIISAQAIRLADVVPTMAPSLKPVLNMIEATCPPLETDRPLSLEIEALAGKLTIGPERTTQQ